MDRQRILDAMEVLRELGAAFSSLPESRENAGYAAMQCELTAQYLHELAKHLFDGDEPYDALLKTAQGNTPLVDLGSRESAVTTLNLLRPRSPKG
jgi:hypothetical protein